MKSEIRKDYIQEKYVIIAPRRGERRHEYPVEEPMLPRECAFCPENIERDELIAFIGPRKAWRFAILKNTFPTVTLNNPKAYGSQEVIVETPHPTRQLHELPRTAVANLLKLYGERLREITKNKKIQYIIIFKNRGGRAGATIVHAHSQIFATSFIPPHLRDKSERALAYRLLHGRCVYCDVIAKERSGPRRVVEHGGVIGFTPYASFHNYEVWIMPTRHIDNVMQLNDRERLSWAGILKVLLAAVEKLGLPYNYYFHEVVFDEHQHLYMKITPRGSVWAGIEIGSGIIINPIAPEEAARYYRKQFKA